MVVFISQQTLIIIIVCSALTAIILAILLYRFVRNCFATPKNLAPLPPVQPLAHHRGRQAATLVANRTSIWYLPTVQQPYISTVSRTSQIPLLPEDNALPPSRLVGQKFGDSEGLFIPPPLDPNPPFSLQSQSLVSVNSLDGSGAHVHARSRPQPKTSSRTGICPRPTSTISIASTHTTRNTIRGTPHGPHSQVQIVLPTPLAPDLAPLVNDEAQSRPASRYEYESDYLSVVDKWVPTNSSISNLRPSSRGDPRTSTSSNGSNWLSTSHHLRRSISGTSHPPRSRSPLQEAALLPVSNSSPPPVHKIPSVYGSHTPEITVHFSTFEPRATRDLGQEYE